MSWAFSLLISLAPSRRARWATSPRRTLSPRSVTMGISAIDCGESRHARGKRRLTEYRSRPLITLAMFSRTHLVHGPGRSEGTIDSDLILLERHLIRRSL